MQPRLEPDVEAAPIAPSLTWRDCIIGPSDSTAVQFFRYVFVGGLAFVVDFGTLYILTSRAGLHYLVSAAVAFLLGSVANYVLSRMWVFPHRTLQNTTVEFAVFALIGLVGLGLNELGMW